MADIDYLFTVEKLDSNKGLAYVLVSDQDGTTFSDQLGEDLLTRYKDNGGNAWFVGAEFNYLFNKKGRLEGIKVLNPQDRPSKEQIQEEQRKEQIQEEQRNNQRTYPHRK